MTAIPTDDPAYEAVRVHRYVAVGYVFQAKLRLSMLRAMPADPRAGLWRESAMEYGRKLNHALLLADRLQGDAR